MAKTTLQKLQSIRRRFRVSIAIGTALVVSGFGMGTTRAEPSWVITGEVPAAIPVSRPQSNWFRPGVFPAISLFRGLGSKLLVGARLRAGVLRNGPAPQAGLVDYKTGGLTSLSLALRAHPFAKGHDGDQSGFWLDMSAGAGVTGTLVRPTVDFGVGWSTTLGRVGVAPVVRFLYVHQPTATMQSQSAHIVLAGLELSLSPRKRQRQRLLPRVAAVAPKPTPARVTSDGDTLIDADESCTNEHLGGSHASACPDDDWDYDGIRNDEDQCPREAEVINGIDDSDGCPDKGVFVVKKDRIVLDARVLFDLNRSRVKSRGRRALRDIIRLWRQRPEWSAMVIEGHSCRLGPENYNQKLSATRARKVLRQMVKLGIAKHRLSTIAFGQTRPIKPGRSERSLRNNRRVEFKLVRERRELHGVRTDRISKEKTR